LLRYEGGVGVGVGVGVLVGVGVGVGVLDGVGVMGGLVAGEILVVLCCLSKNKYIISNITATLSNPITIFRRLDSTDINFFNPHKIKNFIAFA
jgi:uncharacterized protein (DUF2062 family)